MSRRFRVWLVVPAVLLFLVGLGIGALMLLLDPASLKPRLIEAVRRQTGRTLTISGPIGIGWSLTPTITIDGLALDNPLGYARPAFATVERIAVRLSLASLLRRSVDIADVTLIRPDIQLETNAAGRGNWVMRPEPDPVASPSAAAGVPHEGFAVAIHHIVLTDGRVFWRDGVSGRTAAAGLPRLTVDTTPDGVGALSGTIMVQGRAMQVSGRHTGLETIKIGGAARAWPVVAKLETDGATVTAQGHIGSPLTAGVGRMTVDGAMPDPGAFTSWLPWAPLAALKTVAAHVELGLAGGAPEIGGLSLTIGAIDLERAGMGSGARLHDIGLSALGTDPIQVSARLLAGGADIALTGRAGGLAWLLGGASGPVEVELTGAAGAAHAEVKGLVGRPLALSGYGVDVAIDLPDPAAVTAHAPQGVTSVSLRTRLTDAPGPMPFRVTSSAGDLAGSLNFATGARPLIEGVVTSARLDLDALLRVPAAKPVQAAGALVEVPRAAGPPRVFSETPLPWSAARAIDAHVRVKIDSARWSGREIGAIEMGLAVDAGLIRVDPLIVNGSSGRLMAVIEADAALAPPAVHAVLHAPEVAVKPLLALVGLAPSLTGMAALAGDVSATGETPHALAASVSGWLGLAMRNGQADVGVIDAWLASLRLPRLSKGGTSELHCLALRADATKGIAALRAMTLNTASVQVDGEGDIDLGRETLSLRLRPRAAIGGTGLAVPFRVTGPWHAPGVKMDISPSTGAGLLSGLILGGKDVVAGPDRCPEALAQAGATGQAGLSFPPRPPPPSPAVPVDIVHWLMSIREGKS